jgi:[CysO sulfur-carrier protein]-S-L-cysteine hydrolase
MTPSHLPYLPPGIQAEIVAHCQEVLPNQACGLVLFDADGMAQSVERVRNRGAWPYGFQIPAEAQFDAFRRARAERWRVNGVYHCHTVSEAIPTGRDLLRPVPEGFLYIIVSLLRPDRPELRAYLFIQGVPHEVPQPALDLESCP